MPELPEVETCVRTLRPYVVGQTFSAVWCSGLALRLPVDAPALAGLRGSRVVELSRVGKYLLFHLSCGRVLLSHLGMSGAYLIAPRPAPALPHTHVRFAFAARDYEMRYVDPRRFGLVALRPSETIPELLELGPDPLGPAFAPAPFHESLRASTRALKLLLLDQRVVAGLGNIYVAEALFHAGLRPTRRGDQVSRAQAARLHGAIVEVLGRAVIHRGTTLSDGGYSDAEGRAGENQHRLMVYGRGGERCRRCQAPIRQLVQAQRSSFYCARCQR